jgi:DNA polymerase beta
MASTTSSERISPMEGEILKRELIEQLRTISILYANARDEYRSQAFSKAISVIGTIPDESISSMTMKRLRSYRGVGASIADAVMEYIRTGSMSTRLNLAQKAAGVEVAFGIRSPKVQNGGSAEKRARTNSFTDRPTQIPTLSEKQASIDLFTSIYGVGSVTADKWYKRGWRTLDDIRTNKSQLTAAQQIGLLYLEDLKQRIPRSEIERFELALKAILPNSSWTIAGSYRRGCVDSGDVDLLVQLGDGVGMREVVDRLEEFDIIIGTLSCKESKFAGIAHLEYNITQSANLDIYDFFGKARRLDIRVIEPNQWAAALLYFTGSRNLNIQMREEAKRKNWLLNEYGLFDENGVIIQVDTEEDIFELLDMEYLAPNARCI